MDQNYASLPSTTSSKTGVPQSAGNVDGQSVTKRLQSELMQLMMSGTTGISAFPDGDNLFKWMATIQGVQDTPYENLNFKLCLRFPAAYPYSPPVVTFETKCFHPNVDEAGNICLDILKDKWSAVYSVQTVLLSIQSLLGEPNPASPLNLQAAALWSNRAEYKKVVQEKYKQGC